MGWCLRDDGDLQNNGKVAGVTEQPPKWNVSVTAFPYSVVLHLKSGMLHQFYETIPKAAFVVISTVIICYYRNAKQNKRKRKERFTRQQEFNIKFSSEGERKVSDSLKTNASQMKQHYVNLWDESLYLF